MVVYCLFYWICNSHRWNSAKSLLLFCFFCFEKFDFSYYLVDVRWRGSEVFKLTPCMWYHWKLACGLMYFRRLFKCFTVLTSHWYPFIYPVYYSIHFDYKSQQHCLNIIFPFQPHKHGIKVGGPHHLHHQRSQSLNRGVRPGWGSSRTAPEVDMWWQRGQQQCQCPPMGNKLSCSCAPILRKAYRYEDSPWQTSRRRDGHLLRYVAKLLKFF